MLRSAALLALAVVATAFHAPPTAVTQSVATRGRAATTMGPFDFLAFGKAAASHILLDDGGRANFIKQVRRLSSARAASLSLSLLARVLSFSDAAPACIRRLSPVRSLSERRHSSTAPAPPPPRAAISAPSNAAPWCRSLTTTAVSHARRVQRANRSRSRCASVCRACVALVESRVRPTHRRPKHQGRRARHRPHQIRHAHCQAHQEAVKSVKPYL